MGSQPRTFKFYRKNEEEVMKSLGLKPTKNSGRGWVENEDGQNDYLICQLKSTDKQSISINQKDIRILEVNAQTAHKTPCFAIQFLNTGEVWLMAKPEDFSLVSEYISTGQCERPGIDFGIDLTSHEVVKPKVKKVIKSSSNAREEFYKEKERMYQGGKKRR